MKIAQIMKADVEVCGLDDNLAAAASRMWDCDIGCLPVVDAEGQVVGMVTDRDICMAALTRGQSLHEIPVSVAMAREVLSCPPDATLIEAEEIMRSGQVRRLPVGRKNRDLSAQEVTATLAAISAPRQVPEGRALA